MALTIVGVLIQMTGALLTTVYRHPRFGNSLTVEHPGVDDDIKRNKIYSVVGMIMIVVGAAVAIAGAVAQSTC